MRVLLLNYEYPPFGGGGGLSTQALARGLAARGVTVDVVTACALSDCDSAMLWDGQAVAEGLLTVHRVRSRRTGVHQAGMGDAASYLASAWPVAHRLLRAQRYDIVHFVFSLPTGALLPLLPVGNTPVIVSLRGSDVPGFDPHPHRLQGTHRLLRPVTRWIWRRADRVVALSDSLGEQAQRTLPGLRYSVIHNGVDLGRFRPRQRPRSPGPHPVRCLAVARLVERKGLADLLRAIALLEPGRFRLEIVGSGPAEAALQALVDSLDLDRVVTFTGALPNAEVARRYRDADLFTLAPHEDPFGIVFAEALASGLPIVGTKVGGIPELVVPGRNGVLVGPGDPRSLAAGIRCLADDPDLRLLMARRNRAKAEQSLSWDHATDRYLAIYHGAQRRAPSRPPLIELPSSTW